MSAQEARQGRSGAEAWPAPMIETARTWRGFGGFAWRMLPLACAVACAGSADSGSPDPCAHTAIYGASGAAYTTLQGAVDGESAGGTVFLCAGEIPSAVWVAHDITLAGAGLDATTLRWSTREGAPEVGYPVVAVGPNVALTLRDLTIRGADRFGCESTEDCVYLGGGLLGGEGAKVTAERVAFRASAADFGAGIAVGGLSARTSLSLTDCEITANTARASGGGVLLWGDTQLTVTRTTFGKGPDANTPDDVALYSVNPGLSDTALGSYDYDGAASFVCDTTAGRCE